MARRTRLQRPPRTNSAELDQWLNRVYYEINNLPRLSILSTTDGPNSSAETGSKGDILLDIGSSVTAAWVCQSAGTTGWKELDNS